MLHKQQHKNIRIYHFLDIFLAAISKYRTTMLPFEITPKRFGDDRGWFTESWVRKSFEPNACKIDFCQDNHSQSVHSGTIRGLHFQTPPHAQAKLVRCIVGKIFDVAVDVRHGSPTFGKWMARTLSAEIGNQLFVPAGFAHGFLTLEDKCEVIYKVDDYYAPESDSGFAWDDANVAIAWPFPYGEKAAPILSNKDAALRPLAEIDTGFRFDPDTMQPLTDLGAK
jgi:dTDP-4-dehydrorhamnose 3,5-epimerase